MGINLLVDCIIVDPGNWRGFMQALCDLAVVIHYFLNIGSGEGSLSILI